MVSIGEVYKRAYAKALEEGCCPLDAEVYAEDMVDEALAKSSRGGKSKKYFDDEEDY